MIGPEGEAEGAADGLGEADGEGEGEALGDGEADGEVEGALADGDGELMMAGPLRSEHPATGSAHAMAIAAARGAILRPQPVVMASAPVVAGRTTRS